jgi:hypothetical protein
MVANTNSNSSPPLRGRGLLADDDKKSLIKFRKKYPDRFNKLMLKGYKKNKNKWTSRRMTLYVFKKFYFSVPKLCKCGSSDKIQIHHDEYPIKIKDIKIKIDEGKIYYICKKCHDIMTTSNI